MFRKNFNTNYLIRVRLVQINIKNIYNIGALGGTSIKKISLGTKKSIGVEPIYRKRAYRYASGGAAEINSDGTRAPGKRTGAMPLAC